MNRLPYALIVLLLLGANTLFGQANTRLKAYIDQKTFYSPETGSYAEIQLQFVGYTLKYESVEDGLQAKVAIRVVVQNEKNDTIASDAYALESPVMRDSIIEDFFDIVRLPVKQGEYMVTVSLQDLVSKSEPMTGKVELSVPAYDNNVHISDVIIAEVAVKTTEPTVFSKSGYDILPRISNFYPTDLSSMPYYIEIYNTNTIPDSSFALRQRILSIDNKEMTEFTRFTKMKATDVAPVMRNLDISKLPTGSYRLELTVIDRNNAERGKPSAYFFERINEIEMYTDVKEIILDPAFQASLTEDSLAFYLASLIPIARPAEVKNILSSLKTGNAENSRKHIQQFWLQTSGTNAYDKWIDYKKQVLMVEKLYGNNFQNGFETDRGRVYLQYGPPNNIIARETSPSEYPYEIWHYQKIKMYSNKRFVFYNPDLVNNGYRLLHSDMVGEQQNYRWQQMLTKRNSSNTNIDDGNDGNVDHYGGESNYYYRQY